MSWTTLATVRATLRTVSLTGPGNIPLLAGTAVNVDLTRNAFNFGDAPFYDLPSLFLRGIPRGRYIDNAAAVLEAELRYDFTRRWTAIAFGGAGRVAEARGEEAADLTGWQK